MPIVTAGLYRVRCHYNISSGNPLLNVLWYLSSLGEDDLAEDLWGAIDTTIVPLLNACRQPANVMDVLDVEPVFGTGIPFSQAPTSGAGTLTLVGDALPAQFCSSIRKNRSTKEVRSGWIRISGLAEGYITGNTIVGDLATNLGTLATGLETTLSAVGAGFFDPVLVRGPGTYASGVKTDWTAVPVLSCDAILNRVTTQNSRKNW